MKALRAAAAVKSQQRGALTARALGAARNGWAASGARSLFSRPRTER